MVKLGRDYELWTSGRTAGEWAELLGEEILRKESKAHTEMAILPLVHFIPPYSTLQIHPETQNCYLAFKVSLNICPQVHKNSKPRDIPGPLTTCHLL